MRKTAFVFINGILNFPWMRNAWTDLAAEYVTRNLGAEGHVGVKFEYFAGALFRQWGQRKRAMDVLGLYNRLSRDGYRVVLVGHSNAAAIIAYIVTEMEEQLNNVHLFAPAAFDEDYEYAIKRGNLSGLFIYGSTNDRALGVGARFTQTITFGMSGYGTMGLRGAEMEKKHPGIVFDFSNNSFGHGTWFDDEHFYDTMRLVMVNEGLMLTGDIAGVSRPMGSPQTPWVIQRLECR